MSGEAIKMGGAWSGVGYKDPECEDASKSLIESLGPGFEGVGLEDFDFEDYWSLGESVDKARKKRMTAFFLGKPLPSLGSLVGDFEGRRERFRERVKDYPDVRKARLSSWSGGDPEAIEGQFTDFKEASRFFESDSVQRDLERD